MKMGTATRSVHPKDDFLADLTSERSYQVPGKIKVTEHWFKVPLDYHNTTGESLRIFARSAQPANSSIVPEDNTPKQLPWLLFLQGGPGFGCAPVRKGSWTSFLLDRGYRILFLDQRGTGLSSTITAGTLPIRGDAQKQADYLKLFRADNIVRDAEAIRRTLLKDLPEGQRKWSVLGQSFGGFCSVHYLSFYPDSLREVFATGGMPPMVRQPDTVYTTLLRKTAEINNAYYTKFPEDVQRMHQLVDFIKAYETTLPAGTPNFMPRIQNLGMLLISPNGFETIHDILLRTSSDLEACGELLEPTLVLLNEQVQFDKAVLYAIIHEACYVSGAASNWSAERMLAQHGSFDISNTPKDQPIMLTAECITHATFASYKSLRGLVETAEILAKYDGWPDLYDDQQLAKNKVPVYAAIYVDDMAVDFDLSMQRAKAIKGCKTYITNRSWHGGLRENTEEVLGALFALRDDVMA